MKRWARLNLLLKELKPCNAPKTGIVDYRKVADVYREKVLTLGGEIRFNSEVTDITNGVRRSDGTNYTLETTSGEIETKFLVNCAGLHSDLIAAMSGVKPRTSHHTLPWRVLHPR